MNFLDYTSNFVHILLIFIVQTAAMIVTEKAGITAPSQRRDLERGGLEQKFN